MNKQEEEDLQKCYTKQQQAQNNRYYKNLGRQEVITELEEFIAQISYKEIISTDILKELIKIINEINLHEAIVLLNTVAEKKDINIELVDLKEEEKIKFIIGQEIELCINYELIPQQVFDRIDLINNK